MAEFSTPVDPMMAQAMQQFLLGQRIAATAPRMPATVVSAAPLSDQPTFANLLEPEVPQVPAQAPAAPAAAPAAPMEAPAGSGFQLPPEAFPFLLRAGTELMQPMPLWQTAAGHLGRAIQSGVDYTVSTKAGELDAQMKKAQIEQAKAGKDATVAGTEATRAGTTQTRVKTEALLQEMSNEQGLHGLKREELSTKIDQAKKAGLLDEARAKALQLELKTQPQYQAAIVKELLARAKYYEQGGASGAAPTAIMKNVEARAATLVSQGLDPVAARMQAWTEIGMGKSGQQSLANDANAGTLVKLWKRRYELAKSAGKAKGSPEEFYQNMYDRMAAAGLAGEQLNSANLALQQLLGGEMEGGGAPAPAAAPAAPPVPTKMVNGRKVFDTEKMKPGQSYLFPDGSTRTWSGK